ncbi:hypothetical protein GTY65_03040 [Streptomyces sp. SID8379]|uniref:hypothetical protein n=1 Tax=unclassified Streptomyces TaxID=2593676 RepID=UPI0003603F1C|nr:MULTISPECIES: hypothetical protein [unclassified Streptomyces]MYW63058.1 hypothetical protein [Streptomyces sp. SID8379]
MNHPDIHGYVHAARTAELRAQARAHRLRRTARADRPAHPTTSVRNRLGWLLIETGLRFLRPPTVPRPVEH